jgi:23S rRNA pseudouridine1911/1915/1917 synthase
MAGQPGLNKENREENITYDVKEPAKLLEFLLSKDTGKSRNKVKSYLAHRKISVDGIIITQFDHELKPGQQVSITKGLVHGTVQYHGLKIVHEDAYLIVIDKQAGLLSIATDREKDKTAYSILSRHVKLENTKNRIFVVHRLDRETSGIMMFAKNQETQELLQKGWQNIISERNYVTVVEGRVEQKEGTIESFLKESKAMTMFSEKDPEEGIRAITHYKVIKQNDDYSLLEVRLDTGRKNQIRIHMKEFGHSVIGDIKYGGGKSPIKRMGLHAQKLTFKHPVYKTDLSFISPIPKSFMELVKTKQVTKETLY